MTNLTNQPNLILVKLVKEREMGHQVSLYEAKTHLSSLVDRAAAGEEVVIAKNGVPMAKLVPIPQQPERRVPARIATWMADDFDEVDREIAALFNGDDKDFEIK